MILYASDTQSAEAASFDASLPAVELFESERIPLARLGNAEESSCHRGNHFSLAARCPPSCIRCREILERQQLAKRADDPAGARKTTRSKIIKSVRNPEQERFLGTLHQVGC